MTTLKNTFDTLKSHSVSHYLDYEQRQKWLSTLQKGLQQSEAAFLHALHADLHKNEFEAYTGEFHFVLDEIRITLKKMKRWMRQENFCNPLVLLPGYSYLRPLPKGVVLIIAPWNYPLQLALLPVVGALAAGNRVILKPSEMAKASEKYLVDLLSQLFPKELLHVVTGGPEVVQELLTFDFDHVFFTGSTQVGRLIAKSCGEKLIPCTLELGGKSPAFLTPVQNHLAVTARRIAWAKVSNAGQICIAPDYVLLHEKNRETFVKLFIEAFQEFGEQEFARIINDRHRTRLAKLLEGTKIYWQSSKQEVTLVEGDLTHSTMKDEIFGGILPILTYQTEDEAWHILRQHPNPLAFYLFGQDEKKWRQKIERFFPVGGLCINDCLVHITHPKLPFGGVKTSGLGRYHGKYSFQEFSRYLPVVKRSLRADVSLRYPPYTASKLKWIKRLLG